MQSLYAGREAQAGSVRLSTPTAEALVETVYAATGVQNLLLAGIKWMTLGTDFDVNISAAGRARLDHVATAAGCCQRSIFRMNIGFHDLDFPEMSSLFRLVEFAWAKKGGAAYYQNTPR